MINLGALYAEASNGFDPTHNPDAGIPEGTYNAQINDVQYKQDPNAAIWKNGTQTGATEEAESIRFNFEVTDEGAAHGGRAMTSLKFSESNMKSAGIKNIQTIMYLAHGFNVQINDSVYQQGIAALAQMLQATFIGKQVRIKVSYRPGRDFPNVNVSLPDEDESAEGVSFDSEPSFEQPLEQPQQQTTPAAQQQQAAAPVQQAAPAQQQAPAVQQQQPANPVQQQQAKPISDADFNNFFGNSEENPGF